MAAPGRCARCRGLSPATFGCTWRFANQPAEPIAPLTLVLREGVIEHLFDLVVPANMDAERVGSWLAGHPA